MERKALKPGQIIVPGEYEIGNESILKIYFRIFDSGCGEILPPVTVARADVIDPAERKARLDRRLARIKSHGYPNILYGERVAIGDYEHICSLIQTAPYYLLDGNHRTAAATLAGHDIDALELQNDGDLLEVRRMVDRGELFDFKRSETSLYELLMEFECFCMGNENVISGPPNKDMVRTVEQRVEEMVRNGHLPGYMTEVFLKRK